MRVCFTPGVPVPLACEWNSFASLSNSSLRDMAALLPRVFSPVGHLTPLATVSFRVNGSMEPCQYRSPALRLLFVGGGWQASLPRGSSDDRLLLHMYPIRGCKDFEKLPTPQGSVARTVTAPSAIADTSHRTDHGQFIEPIDELGPSAFLFHRRCEWLLDFSH